MNDVRAAELLASFGSPLYVYDVANVRAAYRRFSDAFPYTPRDIHYAIVCNKNPVLVRALLALGAGVHANTPGDAYAALAAGVPASRIVYSGSNLDDADARFVMEHGLRLHVDAVDQIRRLTDLGFRGSLGLRVLVDDPTRANRIGVTPDEIASACALARAGGISVAGVHMYTGTNTRRVDRFLESFDRLIDASQQVADLAWIDVGGGFGLAYRPGDEPLDLARLGAEITARMERLAQQRGYNVALWLEPGRTLVGAAGTLLVTVVSVKERGARRFVGVDSTVGNLVVPSVYHPVHIVEAVTPRGPELPVPTDLCGNTTHSRDFLGRNLRLPLLEPGDVLQIRDVGAYGYAMASHFLNRPLPAEVVIDGDAVQLTTRRETLADLLTTQVTR